MQGIVISYFDKIQGSRTFMVHPEDLELDDNQLHQINKLINFTFEECFFTHQFNFSNTANFYTEIPSVWARGGCELILISVILDSIENPDSWQAPLKEFTTQLTQIPDIYKGFYYIPQVTNGEIRSKSDEIKNLIKCFYESIPEKIIIQKTTKLFIFGLDNAGKTSISKRISENLFTSTKPTLWLDVSSHLARIPRQL